MAKNNPQKSREHQVICELGTAKLLNSFYGSNPQEKRADDMDFRRAPRSGGFDKRLYPGDIHGPQWFPLNMECKFSQTLTADALLFSSSKVTGWWQQCVGDCEMCRRPLAPVLVIRMMRRPLMVVVALDHFSLMLDHAQRAHPQLKRVVTNMLVLAAEPRRPQVVVFPLELFCQQFPTPEILKDAMSWLSK